MLGADLTFGLIGPHPLALYLVQVVLWLLAALAVLGLLRRLFPAREALLVTVVWLVLANHLSLEYWLSTSQAWSAVAACAFGLSLIVDDSRRDRLPLRGLALVTLGVLFYEVTGGVALAGVTVLPWIVTGRFKRRTALVGMGALALAAAWSLGWNSSYPGPTANWMPVEIFLTGTLSGGLSPLSRSGRLVSLVLTIGIVVVLVRVIRRGRRRLLRAEQMSLAGAAVIVLGAIPQVRLPTRWYGMEDRSNTVCAVGLALLLVGLARLALRPLRERTARRVVGVALVAVLAVVTGVIRARQGALYHRQGAAAAAAVTQLTHRPDHHPALVHIPFVEAHWVYGIADGWNATAALQLRTGDPRAVVWVLVGCKANGPPLSDPLATFGAVPVNQRAPSCAGRSHPSP
jgi:hypothetical protein